MKLEMTIVKKTTKKEIIIDFFMNQSDQIAYKRVGDTALTFMKEFDEIVLKKVKE